MTEIKAYTFYRPETGAITHTISCPDDSLDLHVQDHLEHVEGTFDPRTHYLPGGVPTPLRTMMPVVTGRYVANLPVPCTAIVFPEGIHYEIDDGEIEFAPDLPGPYRVLLIADGYLNAEVTLT